LRLLYRLRRSCDRISGHGPPEASLKHGTGPNLEDKEKWPTRLETTTGKNGLGRAVKTFTGLLLHFNWTTVVVVCEAERPNLRSWCLEVHKGLTAAFSGSNLPLMYVDGFSSDTNFTAVKLELNRSRRGWSKL
ncbi:hypothetical protein RvY_18235-1, partial [Ramazzottius varieornatus]